MSNIKSEQYWDEMLMNSLEEYEKKECWDKMLNRALEVYEHNLTELNKPNQFQILELDVKELEKIMREVEKYKNDSEDYKPICQVVIKERSKNIIKNY